MMVNNVGVFCVIVMQFSKVIIRDGEFLNTSLLSYISNLGIPDLLDLNNRQYFCCHVF